MTIVEFLRARLDAREAGIRQALKTEDYGVTERDLIEVQALRRIVDLHEGGHECSVYDHNGDVDNCRWCVDSSDCSTLRLLASIHSDHPDYDPAWRV